MSENVREGSKATFDELWTDVRKFLARDQACNSDTAFAYIQATVMVQTCALLLGDDKYMSEATDTHQIMLKQAQSINLFDTKPTSELRLPRADQDRNMEWQEWIRSEERIRTVVVLYIRDAELSAICQTVPVLNHGSSNIPRAASDELFFSDTLQSWNEILS